MTTSAGIHRPNGPLADFVDCIWISRTGSTPAPQERVIPTGTLALIINLEGNRVRIGDRNDTARFDDHPGSMIFGAHSGYFVIHPPANAKIAGVLFKPGGAPPFLGAGAGALEDGHASLDDLWGTRASRLRERLLEAKNDADCTHLLERALTEGPMRLKKAQPEVALALSAMEDPHLSGIAELRARTGLSAKRLIALFRDEVGIGPKAYWRIRRFQAVLRHIERAQSVRGAEIAADLGYFDQAHMIRDFREFTGLTPRGYLRLEGPHPHNHVPHHFEGDPK